MVDLGEQAHKEEERRQLVPVWPPGEGRPPASPAHKKDQKVTVTQGCFIFINSMRFGEGVDLSSMIIHVTGQFHRFLGQFHRLLVSSTSCWPVPQVGGQCHRLLASSTLCWPAPQVVGQFHRMLTTSTGCWPVPQVVGHFRRLLAGFIDCW
jgi:hypothetical protein